MYNNRWKGEGGCSESPLALAVLELLACHARTKDGVPVHEEGLRKVALDTNNLMVNIMIIRVVPEEHLERVHREAVPAVVVDRLQGAQREKHRRLTCSHPGKELCDTGACSVE